MALVVWDNCVEKWRKQFAALAQDSNFKVPKYKKDDKTTHAWHKTKWSDAYSGSIKNGGWHKGALVALNDFKKSIVDLRKADRRIFTKARQLIRAKNNIAEHVTHHSQKKRGRSTTKKIQEEDIAESYIVLDDDEEDAYSVHSDCSSGEARQMNAVDRALVACVDERMAKRHKGDKSDDGGLSDEDDGVSEDQRTLTQEPLEHKHRRRSPQYENEDSDEDDNDTVVEVVQV